MLSQDRNLWIYLAVCAGLSSTAYWVIGSVTAALVAPVIIFQAINGGRNGSDWSREV